MALQGFTVTIQPKEDSPFNVIPNAPIEIRERLANDTSGGLSVIFSDSAGLSPITQTGATANALGQFTFYAAAAGYNAVYDNNGTPVTIPVDVGVTAVILAAAIDAIVASDIDLDDGQTVEDVITKSATGVLFNKATNLSTLSNPVALAQNQAGSNQDHHIMLWGDSHGWGQGAPNWDHFVGTINFSSHSSYVYNNGFMWLIKRDIESRRRINTNSYSLAPSQALGRIYNDQAETQTNMNPRQVKPMKIEFGELSVANVPLTDISTKTLNEFYSPLAQDLASAASDEGAYREKVSAGLFGEMMMTMSGSSLTTFNHRGNEIFHTVDLDPNYAGSGASYTSVTFGSAGAILAEHHNTLNLFFLVSANKDYPGWIVVGKVLFIPNYGLVEVVAVIVGGGIQLKNYPSGTEIGSAADKAIYPGMKLYPGDSFSRAATSIKMESPHRISYIAVRHQVDGGDLHLGFVDSISGGATLTPLVDVLVDTKQRANEYSPIPSSGAASITYVAADGNITAATAATSNAGGVTIDTSRFVVGVDEEVVYRIDWGSVQQGKLWIENLDAAIGKTVEFRGVVFDNNKVTNFSEGGHTVGAWVGTQTATGSAEQADHVADILQYTPMRPSHVITQIPFVNEYIMQTSILDFKANLALFVSKLNTHFSGVNNFNTQATDFMFFTSLRNKAIAFEGAAESPITYDMYVDAAKDFCVANGHSFIDCEQEFFRLFNSGRSSFSRFYNDSNHPSDFANNVIYEVLRKDYLQFIS